MQWRVLLYVLSCFWAIILLQTMLAGNQHMQKIQLSQQHWTQLSLSLHEWSTSTLWPTLHYTHPVRDQIQPLMIRSRWKQNILTEWACYYGTLLLCLAASGVAKSWVDRWLSLPPGAQCFRVPAAVIKCENELIVWWTHVQWMTLLKILSSCLSWCAEKLQGSQWRRTRLPSSPTSSRLQRLVAPSSTNLYQELTIFF